MKKLLNAIDATLLECNWKDIALLKFCMLAVGLLLGLCVPKKKRVFAGMAATILCLGTFVPLVGTFFPSLRRHLDAERKVQPAVFSTAGDASQTQGC